LKVVMSVRFKTCRQRYKLTQTIGMV
jgi:hypothetical protein